MLENRSIVNKEELSEPGVTISDETMAIFNTIIFSVVCQAINIFGVVTNIINIICFVKQGFEDSVNISLLGLSASDLGSLITMMWTCICMTPAFISADLTFEPVDVSYLTTATPHLAFTRVSGCITAMITLERCLCITAPLQVKSIITPKRATVTLVCVFLIFFCTGVPVYFVNRLGMKFSSLRNKTIFGLVSSDDREYVEKIIFAINSFSIPFGAFVIIVICTTILSVKLRSKAKWRQATNTSSQCESVSRRNQKTAKMVVIISTLFIVCFVPMSIALLAFGILGTKSFQGGFVNIIIICAGSAYVLEGINSSMNIFIYYHMSSKYRGSFIKYFCKEKVSRHPKP